MNISESIARLTKELDAETVSELTLHFLSDTPKQINALHDAAKRNDGMTVSRTAHSLAGSSSTFGLQEMLGASRSLEEAALAGESEKIADWIDALAKAYHAAIPELERYIRR